MTEWHACVHIEGAIQGHHDNPLACQINWDMAEGSRKVDDEEEDM